MLIARSLNASVIAAMLVCVSAQAGLTSTKAPFVGENSPSEILGDVYGGSFSASGSDFTNGAIKAIRVDDDDDQTYGGGTYSARALAAYSSDKLSQSFGLLDGESGGSFDELFDVNGKKDN